MESRVAVLSIIVENEDAVSELNDLLHRYSKYIIGRMGTDTLFLYIPGHQHQHSLALSSQQVVVNDSY